MTRHRNGPPDNLPHRTEIVVFLRNLKGSRPALILTPAGEVFLDWIQLPAMKSNGVRFESLSTKASNSKLRTAPARPWKASWMAANWPKLDGYRFLYKEIDRRKVPPATSDSAQIRKLQDAPRVSLRGEMCAILTSAEQARSAVCWLLAKAAALVLQADLLRTIVV